jgi:hypothetical protein
VKEKTKAYMGGLIDGEGNLTITRPELSRGGINYIPVIGISNCDRRLINWSIRHFGGNYRRRERIEYSNNAQFEWNIYGLKAQKSFLEMIRPYVIFKKPQIDILLEFLKMNGKNDPKKRENLSNIIQALHHHFSVETESLDPLSKIGRAYYSALLDGEGSITISKDRYGHYRPSIRIYNGCLGLLVPLKKAWGGSFHYDKTGNCHQWYINSKKSIEHFLLYSIPYLISKYLQAKTMLRFVRLTRTWNKSMRDNFYVEICRLNQDREKIQPELHKKL